MIWLLCSLDVGLSRLGRHPCTTYSPELVLVATLSCVSTSGITKPVSNRSRKLPAFAKVTLSSVLLVVALWDVSAAATGRRGMS